MKKQIKKKKLLYQNQFNSKHHFKCKIELKEKEKKNELQKQKRNGIILTFFFKNWTPVLI